LLQGARPRPIAPPPPVQRRPVGDLADVRGQAEARRALETAAGGHHLLLVGPPVCGKSMLASRLPGILPPLDDEAALELAEGAPVLEAGRWRRWEDQR
jgi:magnesium chelatase family protein